MARARLTLSGLQLADTCEAAPVLPRIGSESPKANTGSALHEYNVVLGERGRRAADAEADEIADRFRLEGKPRARFFGRARSLDLQIPDGALYELPLCLRADGTVEPVVGGRGSYEVPDDALVAGTLDIVFSTPKPLEEGRWCGEDAVLWTPDLKTGSDAYVAPIDRNWQARVSALLGARWTGAAAVVPTIVYPGPDGGTWDVPMRHGRPAPLREDDLARVEDELRELHARVTEQAARHREGRPLRMVTGAHCAYCAARPGCPAHVAEVRAMVGGETGLIPGPLTLEQAVRGAGLLGPVKKATESLEAALRVYVAEHGPIALPDGRVYGPQDGEEQAFAVRPTYEAIVAELAPLVGEEEAGRFADLAFSTGEKGVYNAIRPAHAAVGFKKKMKAAFERITANPGVVTMKPTVKWSAHYPRESVDE